MMEAIKLTTKKHDADSYGLAWKLSVLAVFLLCGLSFFLAFSLPENKSVFKGKTAADYVISEDCVVLQQPLPSEAKTLTSVEIVAESGVFMPRYPSMALVDAQTGEVVQKATVSYRGNAEGTMLVAQFNIGLEADGEYLLRMDFSECLGSKWSFPVYIIDSADGKQSPWAVRELKSKALSFTCSYAAPNGLFLAVGILLGVTGALLAAYMYVACAFQLCREIAKRLARTILSVIYKHPFLSGVGYNLLIFVISCCLAYPANESTDDFTIGALLSGLNGFASPYVLVLGYPLSLLIYGLQWVLPALNWLTVFEMVAAFSFFAVLSCVLWEKKAWISITAGFLMPLMCAPTFYNTLNYTRSAALSSFAGLILFVSALCDKNRSKRALTVRFLVAAILCALGAAFRYMCFWLAFPFAGVCWLVIAMREFSSGEKRFQIPRAFLLRTGSGMAVVLLAVMAIHGWDSYAIQHYDAEMQEYVSFNSVRAKVTDYEKVPYEQVEDELQQYHVSENDYKMLSYSMLNDAFFSKETLAAIADVQKTEDGQEEDQNLLQETMEQYFYRMGHSYLHITKGSLTFYYPFLITALLALFFLSKRTVWGYVFIFAGVHVCGFYFLYTGRFPSWVQNSLFVIAIGALLYCLDGSGGGLLKKATKPLRVLLKAAGIALVFLALLLGNDTYFPNVGVKYIQPEGRLLCETLAEREDDVFILDSTSNIPFAFIHGYGTLQGLPRGGWANIFRCGNWDLQHPSMLAQLEDLGITSAARQLVQDNVYLVSVKGNFSLEMWKTFLKEHYNIEAEAVLREELYGFAIYQFVPVK